MNEPRPAPLAALTAALNHARDVPSPVLRAWHLLRARHAMDSVPAVPGALRRDWQRTWTATLRELSPGERAAFTRLHRPAPTALPGSGAALLLGVAAALSRAPFTRAALLAAAAHHLYARQVQAGRVHRAQSLRAAHAALSDPETQSTLTMQT